MSASTTTTTTAAGLVLAAGVAAAAAYFLLQDDAPAGPTRRLKQARETFQKAQPKKKAITPKVLRSQVPKPGDPSPLVELLARAVERGEDEPQAAGQMMPWDDAEIRGLLGRVLERVNRLSPGADLALVTYDAVSKVVDASRTIWYEANLTVHSHSKGFSGKATARVSVDPRGVARIRALDVHSGSPDDPQSGPAPSRGPQHEEAYAAFHQVATYTA